MEPRASVRSVNLGAATPSEYSDPGVTGIDERPVAGPVEVTAFRALTTEPELLPLLVGVAELPAETRELARRRTAGSES
ncbi:hypothetical protein [Kitasatospora azatica]|uniref:hypothetical protein n=1 Tax=Kitasatospora azatica TaxID=58347 RepID=UPI000569EF7E|nr:hypothetical protein [Kitasatospora azatica]